ncbi:hypothetical protein [Dactylosporangium sp. CA-092794]|uniref:hypothetical protein n=1 Tax=Dactylosporangium sp. CA-092794 TaxID=3239929 RepID=UPI003D8B36FB
MTIRWLRDDHDIYYDASDIFGYAAEGGAWTDRWHVAHDSVEVGDVFYLVWPEHKNQVQARAVAVAAAADDDPGRTGLGPAYCADLWEMELDDGPAMCVRIEIESAADMDHELALPDLDLAAVESGDVIPADLAADLARRWDAHVDGLLATGKSLRRDPEAARAAD